MKAGILLDELFEKWFYNPICVSLALIIAGILFITTALQNGDIPYVIVGVGMMMEIYKYNKEEKTMVMVMQMNG